MWLQWMKWPVGTCTNANIHSSHCNSWGMNYFTYVYAAMHTTYLLTACTYVHIYIHIYNVLHHRYINIHDCTCLLTLITFSSCTYQQQVWPCSVWQPSWAPDQPSLWRSVQHKDDEGRGHLWNLLSVASAYYNTGWTFNLQSIIYVTILILHFNGKK